MCSDRGWNCPTLVLVRKSTLPPWRTRLSINGDSSPTSSVRTVKASESTVRSVLRLRPMESPYPIELPECIQRPRHLLQVDPKRRHSPEPYQEGLGKRPLKTEPAMVGFSQNRRKE